MLARHRPAAAAKTRKCSWINASIGWSRRGRGSGGARWGALLLAAATAVLGGCKSGPVDELPMLGADEKQTSVSGVSAGAYMAGQFQLAHSRHVIGAGIIAGGPYGCAESVFADQMPGPGTAFLNLSKAVNGCMHDSLAAFGVPNPRQLADRARQLAAQDRIDPVEGLARDRVYLFSGRADHTVAAPIVAAAAELYRNLGVPPASIALVTDIAAGHGFVTASAGSACDRTAAPYIVDCDYDQAGKLLEQIYGPLAAPSEKPAGPLLVFDQRSFVRDLHEHGLADQGMAYIPGSCRDAPGCRVHIVFHGCGQSRIAIGDTFARETGFARWADTNRLIVLFPQVDPGPVNPQGCWDWWGYTGRDYLTRKGPQIVAVQRMLERLAASPTGS